jgi:hypothetical protein
VVLAAAISRYASTYEGYLAQRVDEPGFAPMMLTDLLSGQHRNPDRVPTWFTTAFFHTRDELAGELAQGGVADVEVLPVEGPFEWAPGVEERLADPRQRDLLLEVIAATEADWAVAGATAHMLAVGRR